MKNKPTVRKPAKPEPLKILTDQELAKFGEYLGNRFEEDSEPITRLSGFFEYLVRVLSENPKSVAGKKYGPTSIDDITYAVRQAMFNHSHAGNEAFYAFNESVLPAFRECVKA